MATRIQVVLSGPERNGLTQIAKEELRDPRDQLRHILRQELYRRGLLEKEGEPGKKDGD